MITKTFMRKVLHKLRPHFHTNKKFIFVGYDSSGMDFKFKEKHSATVRYSMQNMVDAGILNSKEKR